MNLILCGMMGAGKTTVGVALASLTGRRVYDVDEEIVKKHGRIADIFARYGERYFREIETETARELSCMDEVIISVGGGLVLKQENVEILQKKGKIVYLRASLATLTKRLVADGERPLLQTDGESLACRIERLLKERAPIYESVADFVVDVDEKTPEQIAAEILKIIDQIKK